MNNPETLPMERAGTTMADPQTEGRLIVMGGTAEEGVFQVEIILHPDIKTNHRFVGSIFLVYEENLPCLKGCCRVRWKLTPEALAHLKASGGTGTNNMHTCPKFARRLD